MIDLQVQIMLGIIQGIVEWLPFSSEGALLLYTSNFVGPTEIDFFLKQALFLHLGTFFAAVIYFRKELKHLVKSSFHYKESDRETKKVLQFLLLTTIVTGIVGLAALKFLDLANINHLPKTSTSVNIIVGLFLLVTGFVQLKARSAGFRREMHLDFNDSLILGVLQGIAVIPGLSRSGLTVSGFLFKNFDETVALRMSFIMSLPVVFIGNLLLTLPHFEFTSGMIVGFIFSFIFGLATIHLLMKLSEKVKFGHFVIFFAILMILSSLI